MKVQNPHDKFFKETFSDVTVARDFLYHYLSDELLIRVDLDSLEPEKDTFIDEKMKEHFSDLLFRAKIGDEIGYFYFLFEHKSYPSDDIVLQLYRYLGEIFHAKMNKEKTLEIPIVLPLVMYHGNKQWDAPRSLNEMIVEESKHAPSVSRYIPNFEYLLFDFSPWTDLEIYGHAILRAYLMIVKAINELEGEEFIEELIRIILYLREIEDAKKGIDYLRTMLRYVYSVNRDLTDRDMEIVVERIEHRFPEGSETIMTLAEIYMEKGKTEGRAEGILEGKREIARNLLSLNVSLEKIVKATGLSEDEIKDLKNK